MFSIALLLLKTIIWDSLKKAYQRNSGLQFCLTFFFFFFLLCILHPCLLPFLYFTFCSDWQSVTGEYSFCSLGKGESTSETLTQSTTCCQITELTNTHTQTHKISQWLFLTKEITAFLQKSGGFFKSVVLLCRMLCCECRHSCC